MKKLLFICVIMGMGIASGNKAFGQPGLTAGLNIANINGGDVPDDAESRAGIFIGGFYQIPLEGSPIVMQPELFYSMKGYNVGDFTVKLNYIIASVLATYYAESSGSVAPFGRIGPYLAQNVTSKIESDGDEMDLDDVNNTDIGVIIRAGVRVNNQVDIGARFTQGLTNAFKDIAARNYTFGVFVEYALEF